MGAVARLNAAGLRVEVRGDTLLVEPRAVLTEELREFIRSNKFRILDELDTLERRRSNVVAELQAHPQQRIAVDIAGAPLRPEPGEPVSLVIACRTAAGIFAGEMHAPRERFDAFLFLAVLAEAGGRPQ